MEEWNYNRTSQRCIHRCHEDGLPPLVKLSAEVKGNLEDLVVSPLRGDYCGDILFVEDNGGNLTPIRLTATPLMSLLHDYFGGFYFQVGSQVNVQSGGTLALVEVQFFIFQAYRCGRPADDFSNICFQENQPEYQILFHLHLLDYLRNGQTIKPLK